VPLGVPVGVDELWRRADPAGDAPVVVPFPPPCDPGFAADSWRELVRYPGMLPRLLLPVCYASHVYVLVELDGPETAGGALFGWASDGSGPFALLAADAASYIAAASALPDADDDDGFRALLAQRLRERPHPVHGSERDVDGRPEGWPHHWLASVGPVAFDRTPLGVTTTCTNLQHGRAGSGRVHGRVRRIVGGPDGAVATLDDGTGLLDVWCSSAVSMYGPVKGRSFELDVVADEDGVRATAVRPIS
jgi:hypothetical protein